MPKFYKAQLTSVPIIITIVVSTILVCALILLFKHLRSQPNSQLEVLLLILISGIMVVAFLFRPIQYVISSQSIEIKRLLLTTRIPFTEIVDVKRISSDDLDLSIRVVGSGGYWGYFGVFYSRRYGKLIMHASNLVDLVLIVTKSGMKHVISPNDVASFVKELSR